MSSPIDEMIEALEIEVAAIKKCSGSTKIELRGGAQHGSAGSDTIYVFPLTEELYLRDDSPVKIYVAGQEVDGTIVSVANGILTIALSENLGPEIPFARLVVNDSFLIERLRDKLIEIGNSETAFQQSSANAVLNNGPATVGESDLSEAVLSLGKLLNDDQQLAVRRSLGSNLLFVWGPPGTGKTSTLAAMVHALYLNGKSILLVSNTNIAVDTALERIGDRLNSLPDFHSAAVLRFGPIVSDTLRKKYESQVNLDKVVGRHSAALVAEKNKVKDEGARLLTQKANAERIIDAFRSLHAAEQRYEQLLQQYEQLKRESAKHKQASEQLEAVISQSRSDLARAQSMGAVRKFFSGLNEEKLRHTIAASKVQLTSLQSATSACEQRIQKCIRNGAHVQKEIDSGKERLKSVPPESDCRKRLAEITARLSEHETRIKAIDDELASIRQQLVSKCRVLATTVYQTYLKSELARPFDVVIVDEASMLPLPMVFYSAGKATDRVIVAGDFRQLPPIVVSDDERCEKWLKTDVFHHAGITKSVNAGHEPPTLVTLREQFRMQDDICGLLNRLFYDNQLRTAPIVRNRVLRRPFANEQGLLFVDTSSWQPWASCRLGSFSRYNVLHALLIRNIVRRLASEGYLGEAGEVNERLGVVSPFAAQCRLLAQLIGEVLNTRGSLYAATVHRFQGNERDAMICDITDSIGCRLSKFAKASQIDEDGARLLNVAMSRGRLCTVIIANFEFLNSKLSRDSYLRRILDHFKNCGAPLDIASCAPFDAASILNAERMATGAIDLDSDVDGLAAYREGTFYQAFRADCTNAEREIVVFSPYMTERGTSRWIDLWRAKLSQGIRIRIVTRPPGDQGGSLEHGLPELLESVRAVGIAVDLRARMHEKMAFVDRRWLWHGSLNILSHRDTSESMLRLDSPAACEQVGRFVISDTAKQYRDFDLANGENPTCECGRPMIWNNGRFGVWFECDCGHKANATGKVRQSTRRLSPRQKPGGKKESKPLGDCPQCGKPLKSRTGRRGPFIGCTGYPKCRYTADLK